MYTMYARPVSAIIEHSNIFYHSYADDTQLYIQCDNNEESVRCAISHLEQCISEICEWMKQNSLKINQDKTEYIIFSSKPDQYKHISLTVGRDIIHPSEYVRIIGVTLDSDTTQIITNKQAFKSEVKKVLWFKLIQTNEDIFLFY